MILDFVRRRIEPVMITQLLKNGVPVGNFHFEKEYSGEIIQADICMGENYARMDSNCDEGIYFLDGDAKKIGSIDAKIQEFEGKHFFGLIKNNWSYEEFVLQGHTYRVLEIGLGKANKTYYQFEEDEKTVGIIQKISKVENHYHKYKILTETENMVFPLLVFASYLEATKYYPYIIAGEGNTCNTKTVTSPKFVRKLLDYEYVLKIQALEEK